MARTGETLFKELTDTGEDQRGGKGRDQDLHRERNQLLYARYYYYVVIVRMQMEAAYDRLMREDFRARYTIIELIASEEGRRELAKMRNEAPKKSDLDKMWPHMKW